MFSAETGLESCIRRQERREMLSSHISKDAEQAVASSHGQYAIEDVLGLEVLSGSVRLRPKVSDEYHWRVPAEKKWLLSKYLGSHSTGTFKLLCASIGKDVTAIDTRNITDCKHPLRPIKEVSLKSPIHIQSSTYVPMADLHAHIQEDLSATIEARCQAERLTVELQVSLQRAEERIMVLDKYCAMLRLHVEASRRGGDIVRDALLQLQSMLQIDALELAR